MFCNSHFRIKMNSTHNLQVYTKTRNAISSLLVNQLKQVLREEGLTISGTKNVLIDRVEKRELMNDLVVAQANTSQNWHIILIPMMFLVSTV